jgi:radical SAM superfamily enzyme YgiQ (UPF0313 family)
MMRRIILVDLPWRDQGDERPSLSHASLLASLRTQKQLDVYPVVQVVSDRFSSTDLLAHRIRKAIGQSTHGDADVAIGAFIWNERVVQELTGALRRRGFNGRIVLGGPQITYAGTGLETMYPGVDVFIRGQAESALCKLATVSGRPKICGVHYAGDADLCEQASTPFLDAPSPWLSNPRSLNHSAHINWETQRGCHFRCSFCQHRQPDSRTPVVKADSDRIDREIDLFCQADVARISVLDPVFNQDQNHALRIMRRFITRGFEGELSFQCRAEMINAEFLDVAQQLNVCLEFGLQSIHKREYLAVGRPNNMGKVEAALREVVRRQIPHEVSLIYGLPEQKVHTFKESVDWCKKIGVEIIKAYPLLLLRGTELENNRDKWSLEVADGDLPIVIGSNSFDLEDWKAMDRIASSLAFLNNPKSGRLREFEKDAPIWQVHLSGARNLALGKIR